MTKEQDKATIQALLWEREGYERRVTGAKEDGDEEAVAAAKERIAAVDAQLKKLGAGAQKRSQAAQKRPSSRKASTR